MWIFKATLKKKLALAHADGLKEGHAIGYEQGFKNGHMQGTMNSYRAPRQQPAIQITTDQWKKLVSLCHPDKHGNANRATETMQWLNSIRPMCQ